MTNEVALLNDNGTFCSFRPKTVEEKKKLFNTLESCDHLINDMVGQHIMLKNIYIQKYEKTDKDTGETRTGYRTILFDENDESYVTASSYFFIALCKFLSAFGNPSEWEAPIEIEFVKKDIKDGKKALSFKTV